MLKNLLQLPQTRGLDLDDPHLTDLRHEIIRGKPFLYRIYQEWYELLNRALPTNAFPVLEIGSGGGFYRETQPRALTSEIFRIPGVDAVLNAQQLPFADGTLGAIVMVNVLHHLPDVRQFFLEASRCVAPGGVIAMVEPWFTGWSGWVYRNLHHEPFDPAAPNWHFSSSGALSGANGALPWILFERDRKKFERAFPHWQITRVQPFMPLRYLLSGGVSMRALMPAFTYPLWRALETALTPAMPQIGMFAHIVLTHQP